MNDSPKTTTTQWFWFILQTALIALFVLISTGLRIAMINLHAQQFKSMPYPWITNIVLFSGPLHLETIYATLIFVVTTLIAVNILLKGNQRSVFMSQVSITLLWCSLIYLTLLCFVFSLCYYRVDTRLYNSDNPPPPAPIPDSSTPPQFWFIASLIYLVAMLVVVLWVHKRRKNKATTSA